MKKLFAVFAVLSLLAFNSCSDTYQFPEDSEVQSVTTEISPESPAETEETTTTETESITEETTTESITEETTTESDEIFNDYDDNIDVQYNFRTQKQLNQHFEKHGNEFEDIFDYETAEDYEQGASDVINNPDALYKTEKEDGDGVYYIESTNEFVILSTDGYIRTYFRPRDGISYFNRQ